MKRRPGPVSKTNNFTRVQTKVLTVADTGGGEMAAACTFNNLKIGAWYRLSGVIRLYANVAGANNTAVACSFVDGANTILDINLTGAYIAGITTTRVSIGINSIFKATTATLTPVPSSTHADSPIIQSTSSTVRDGTFLQLEEIENMIETAEWT